MTDNKSKPRGPHRSGRGKFKKGSSGNSKGRPKGSRNKASILAEQLLDGEAEEITRACIERAKEGDPTALKLVMEKLLPRRKGRPIHLEGLPTIKSVKDMAKAYDIVIEAMSNGDISPDEAETILPILEGKLDVARNWINDDIWPNAAGVAETSNEKPTA